MDRLMYYLLFLTTLTASRAQQDYKPSPLPGLNFPGQGGQGAPHQGGPHQGGPPPGLFPVGGIGAPPGFDLFGAPKEGGASPYGGPGQDGPYGGPHGGGGDGPYGGAPGGDRHVGGDGPFLGAPGGDRHAGGGAPYGGEKCDCLRWTNYINADTPGDTGDFETLGSPDEKGRPGTIHHVRPDVCTIPVRMECRTVYDKVAWYLPYEKITHPCNPMGKGFACENKKQKNGKCRDYEVRLLCFYADKGGSGDYSCPCLSWSQWYDNDDPNDNGDEELVGRKLPRYVCAGGYQPVDVQCVTVSGLDVFHAGNKKVQCDLQGLSCYNEDQGRNCKCHDYKVRFLCPKFPATYPIVKYDTHGKNASYSGDYASGTGDGHLDERHRGGGGNRYDDNRGGGSGNRYDDNRGGGGGNRYDDNHRHRDGNDDFFGSYPGGDGDHRFGGPSGDYSVGGPKNGSKLCAGGGPCNGSHSGGPGGYGNKNDSYSGIKLNIEDRIKGSIHNFGRPGGGGPYGGQNNDSHGGHRLGGGPHGGGGGPHGGGDGYGGGPGGAPKNDGLYKRNEPDDDSTLTYNENIIAMTIESDGDNYEGGDHQDNKKHN